MHRTGAAPGDQGPLVIPGSCGSYSCRVAPVGDQSANTWSLAHGTGRKRNRGAIRDRLEGEVSPDSPRQTKLGSLVICKDRDLLCEEAPEACKKIEQAISDLREPGLIRVLARSSRVTPYKVSWVPRAAYPRP